MQPERRPSNTNGASRILGPRAVAMHRGYAPPEIQKLRSSDPQDRQPLRCSDRAALVPWRSDTLVREFEGDESEALSERLAERAQSLARDIVARRLVPLFKLPFHLAQRLQRVAGALEAFDVHPGVLLPAVRGFCAVLHEHPHDLYDRDFSPVQAEAFWIEVCDAWRKVRIPGSDALIAAFQEAQRNPIALLPPADVYGPRFVTVVSVAYHLQRAHGDAPVFLPVAGVGGLMGVDRSTVGALISHGRRLGLLIEIDPPHFRTGRARTLRFVHDSSLYRPPSASDQMREPGEDDE
jgi:hypothetical protein